MTATRRSSLTIPPIRLRAHPLAARHRALRAGAGPRERIPGVAERAAREGPCYPSRRCPPPVRCPPRSATPRPGRGRSRLLGEAIEDVLLAPPARPLPGPGRHQEEGRRHVPRQPLVDLDPLLQMVRVRRLRLAHPRSVRQPDYPLFILAAILPWKWFTSSINDAATSVSGQEKLIQQIQFPKIVLPDGCHLGGGRRIRVRPDAPRRHHAAVPASDQRLPAAHPGHRLRPVRVHARGVAHRCRDRTCSSATSATSCATCCACGSTCRPRSTAWRCWRRARPSPSTRDPAHARSANPFATLFESYRAVIYGEPRHRPACCPTSPLSAHSRSRASC